MPPHNRVLVVDDSPDVRVFLSAYLERAGYDVSLAEDGEEGLQKLRAELPDVVLCDLRMPRLDGLELLRSATREHPEVPIVVMSGAGLLGDAIAALKLGAWDYVLKPILDSTVLAHAINRALERAALVRENERYRKHLEKTNLELSTSLHLLAEDEQAGRRIQFRLLPANHRRFDGYEISRDLMPSTYLSGDFVDCFSIDDARIGFYLADVAGHGVSSAFVTVCLKSFINRQRERHEEHGVDTILSPKKTVERLNQELIRDGLGKHLTMCYGVIDTRNSELTYACGGQYPLPVYTDGKRSRFLEGQGLPVGLFDFATYDEQRMRLDDEFVFALCSDGVLEILPDQGLQAKARHLLSLFDDIDVTVESIHDALAAEAQWPLPDDVTVLLVKGRETHA